MVSNPMRDPAVTVGIGGDASGLTGAVDDAIGSLGNLRAAAGVAGAALAALGVGGLAAATREAAAFEEQMVEVEKVTSPEIAEEMAGSIRDMAAEMPIAQEELAGIAAQAGRFGVEGTDNMEQFTESVAQMAVATDLSSQQAGEAFARMTTLMDEPIANIQNLGDAVNGLSNNMATSASEITNASTRSSGALSQLGLQSEEILALNASMNEVSASSRIAGTRLRRFAQELQDPGKTEDLAAALGMTAGEFQRMSEENPNELMRTMVERFEEGGESADALRSTLSTTSRQALAGLAQNTEGWSEAQSVANEQMGEGESLAEEYSAASDTFNSQLQVFENRLRNVAIEIGTQLLPAASRLLGHVNSAVERFSEWNEATDGMLGVSTLLSAVVAGASVAIAAFGSTIAAVATTAAAIAAPLLAIVATLGVLAHAWRNNWGGIRDVTMRVVNWIRGHAQKLWQDLLALWRVHGEDLVSELVATGQAIRGYLQPFLDGLRLMWSMWGDEIMAVVNFAMDFVRTTLVSQLDAMLTAFRVGLALIRGDWEEAWELIEGFADRTLERISDLVDPVLETIRDVIGAIESAVSKAGDLADVDVPGSGAVGGFIESASSGTPFHTGGRVTQGGAAVLKAGETVLPPAGKAPPDGGGTTVNIERIVANDRAGGRAAGRAFHRELKGQGFD